MYPGRETILAFYLVNKSLNRDARQVKTPISPAPRTGEALCVCVGGVVQ